MSKLKYVPKPWTFDHRMAMCLEVHDGCETEDIIGTLCSAARMLHAYEDHYCEIVLTIAEKVATEYVKNWLWARQCDWEEYDQIDPEVYTHFTGGAKKLTREEFEKVGGV